MPHEEAFNFSHLVRIQNNPMTFVRHHDEPGFNMGFGQLALMLLALV